MTSFTQIIFPTKIKSPVDEVVVENLKATLMFSMVFCTKKDDWVSLIRCVKCDCAERSLADIMADQTGC